MEFTLHKQLKHHYCGDAGETEVRLGKFRIDAVLDDVLFEIQLGSLSAIRDKIRSLSKKHKVVVVKPIVTRKRLVKLSSKRGRVTEERWSPRRHDILNLFDELVYFTKAFPHPNLKLQVPLLSVVETRYPGCGKRRRRRDNDFQILDRELLEIQETRAFACEQDLLDLLPVDLPAVFDTADLAKQLQVQRWMAQRIAYCLRNMGGLQVAGKRRNTMLYELAGKSRRAA